MELGQRIKNARLEMGLSQRQLCGDTITRNMLSQIENGSARPSMDTLACLAQRLGKPVSFFLEENTVTSPNRSVMEQARRAYSAGEYHRVRDVLADYREPDETFNWEKNLLQALTNLALAEQAVKEARIPYAQRLLGEAGKAGAQTPYYTASMEARRQLLLAQTGKDAQLPDVDAVLLCRAEEALRRGDHGKAGACLDACEGQSPRWHLLRGQAFWGQKAYRQAVSHLQRAEEKYPQEAVVLLEQCCSALEDYKMAYFYACKQKK